jgi:hypothetical protein
MISRAHGSWNMKGEERNRKNTLEKEKKFQL